jgi:hypothetical protein
VPTLGSCHRQVLESGDAASELAVLHVLPVQTLSCFSSFSLALPRVELLRLRVSVLTAAVLLLEASMWEVPLDLSEGRDPVLRLSDRGDLCHRHLCYHLCYHLCCHRRHHRLQRLLRARCVLQIERH